jgi:hypothetical protein
MKTFDIDLSANCEDNLSFYYGEWHISDKLANYLAEVGNKKIRLTIEVLEEENQTPQELVTLTYRELFKRATDQTLTQLGVNVWYINEGGDPTTIIDIPKDIALQFMLEEEFNHRKHDENS